ncbi:MAG TPA: tRNA uridine(34) 5-carboxymethylaminomethyl modification radical SAM/GNAT enzyme Elp3 [Nitrososphaeraceae archaeon]|nr:tRNA uridine(34) 5-carboxymethylaminomethyl modification radical SAM/GNAT enzyme Elp3 [Nitrososphaeraceae archaeon]
MYLVYYVIIMDSLSYSQACKSIAVELENNSNMSLKEINKIISLTCSTYELTVVPKKEHIIPYLPKNSNYRDILVVKPAKTASGVAVIAVMPKPYDCPHGKCIYCPGGLEYNTPMSYVGTEPATKIAQSFEYDAYYQIKSKLNQLYQRGHNITKIELVIVGGTFPFMAENYQREFVKKCFDALNDDLSSTTLDESCRKNEQARIRCVGFTVETKPDYCKEKHLDLMLELGITRIEIGVQTLEENIYKLVNRGHNLTDVKHSFQIARNCGYKIVAHMMPGLPGSTPESDINGFKTLLENDSFKPDMLKIYPTLVLKNTGLYKLYMNKKYDAYTEEDIVNILVEVKKLIPPWVRIMRIQREIETSDIIAGSKKGNIRQIAIKKLKDLDLKCNCIRCREAGLKKLKNLNQDEITLNRIDYLASEGKEVFLSMENKDKNVLFGFLRLRNIPFSHRKELHPLNNKTSAIIRELHVYGQVVDIGQKKGPLSFQHTGLGLRLMEEAEKISKEEFQVDSLSVISAIGTRAYYRKLGYVQNGPYVTKQLK